jgi:beta-phosphoglucomutase-like phosphatase (HAD superfamily)
MNPPRPRALVLDMDGLMLDTESIYRHAWQTAARDFGHAIDDGLYLRFVGRSNRDAEGALLELFGAGFPLGEFRRRWLDHWHEHVERQGIECKPGLGELLAWADERRVPCAVATSTAADEARLTLGRAGLGKRFDTVVTGDRVERGKPAPDIFLAAARALGVVPEQCVALEDSEAGTIAACDAGMRAIVVPDLQPVGEETRRRAFRVVDTLHAAREVLETLFGRRRS